ncbi:MAG: rhodanese-like domain-containing protein, partial [Pseudohongiellaceae bacterium]
APQGWRPLLEPAELATLLQQAPEIRVLQVTGNFARGHLPGAVESSYASWRGPIENPGALPDLSTLTQLVQNLGIEVSTPVVVVHAGSTPADMGSATRVYWTLKSLGVMDVAVINGGLQAWRDQGLPLSTESAEVFPSDFMPRWNEQWRVTTAEVEALVESGEARLIDSRPPAFFQGLQSSFGRPGTIKGASNLTYESWFDGDRLRTVDELRAIYAAHGSIESPITVNFCNTGHWSSISWFVMSELLQVSNTRLYAESIAEWSQRYRPMDNQPGRLSIYGKLTRDWLQSLINRDS